MFGKLTGKVDEISGASAIILIGGVGYKVNLTEVSIGKLATMEDAELYIHTYVREDAIVLYGFLEREELDMFELLIGVSGIGPKAALGILSIASPKAIKTAIISEDSSILTRVSGVGKRTAERVILELQNKIDDLPAGDQESAQTDQEVIEALTGMGYSVSEAREAAKAVSAKEGDISDKIKEALKVMKK